MKKVLFILLSAVTVFSSCKKEDKGVHFFKGAEQNFQEGKAWTWYEEDAAKKPLRLAISIDHAAMQSLDRSVPGDGEVDHDDDIVVPFHPKVGVVTPFDHVGLGWNPHGHEPDVIYGLPHFDFHFYEVSASAVAAIPPYEVDSTKFKNWPAPQYLPANYVNFGGGVPQMGCHWLDVTSPELNGQTFTQTFIYGSYDGQVTFYEPMITEAFILNNPSFERSIPQPEKVQKTGYYPTKLRVETMNGTVNIILENFVYRIQS